MAPIWKLQLIFFGCSLLLSNSIKSADLSHSLGVFGIMLWICDLPGAWVTKWLEEFALGSLGLFIDAAVMDQLKWYGAPKWPLEQPEHANTKNQILGHGIRVLFQIIFHMILSPQTWCHPRPASKYSSQGPRARAHPVLVARIQTDFLRSHFNRAWIQTGRW